MKSSHMLTASLNDIVFANRNKDYGAYELRLHYPLRIFKATLATGVIILFMFAGSLLARSVVHRTKPKAEKDGIHLTEVVEKHEEVIIKQEKKIVPVQTIKFTTLKIVKEEDYHEPPPDQDALAESRIDLVSHEGEKDNQIAGETLVDITGVIEGKKETEPAGPFEKVEIEAKFPGNWKNFLERNLDADVPIRNSAPEGRYTVEIKFVVDLDGSVSNITPLTQIGYGMEQEAVRVLKKASKWEPAIQNGNKVKAYRIQRIIFEVLADS
ncbi:MAG TPA: energy transducer TonB [Chitinophagaceae bacterium]|nr:energy transducer TonB [Chitinophagaceae bacterium]